MLSRNKMQEHLQRRRTSKRDRKRERHHRLPPIPNTEFNKKSSEEETDIVELEAHTMYRLTPVHWQTIRDHHTKFDTGAKLRKRREKSPVWNASVFPGNSKRIHKYGSNHNAEQGIYHGHVNKLLEILTRENSVMLPPLQTSGRIKHNVFDPVNLAEKSYVMKDYFTEGKISKFARDEVYVPSVYKDYFKCKDCRRKYISDKYIETFSARNVKTPICPNKTKIATKEKAHFCDVLGKRSCQTCGEIENRKFGSVLLADLEEIPAIQSGQTTPILRRQKKKKNKRQVVINMPSVDMIYINHEDTQ